MRALWIGCVLAVALGTVLFAESGPAAREPIVIQADTDFTPENGVRSGTGTELEPFRISGWTIDASGATHCILIEDVSAAFEIVDCVLLGATTAAIELSRVLGSGCVRESCIAASAFGVSIKDATRCSIECCTFRDIDWAAVFVSGGSGHRVSYCLFGKASPGILVSERSTCHWFVDNVFLSECRAAIRMDPQCGGNVIARNDFYQCVCRSASYNRWDDGPGQGNYWSRYRWPDSDGDGIGDTPYAIVGDSRETDRFPAMSPFHPSALDVWGRCPEPVP